MAPRGRALPALTLTLTLSLTLTIILILTFPIELVAACPHTASCSEVADSDLHGRCKREPNPLIGTYDISKIFQRKKMRPRPRQQAAVGPSALPLRHSPPAPPGTHGALTAETATATDQKSTGNSTKKINEPKETKNDSGIKTSDDAPTDSRLAIAVDTTTKSPDLAGAAVNWTSEADTGWRSRRGAARAAEVGGALVLGALVPVRAAGRGAAAAAAMAGAGVGAGRCGRAGRGGVLWLEALLFALDRARPLAPPGVTIGAHVLDDCDDDAYGLEMALDFIKGSISNIEDAGYACNATAVRKVISGVIGAASSVTSVQVANLLRLFKIPQVSYFSTSPELSNKARFEYFTRTIPSDLHQVRAMVEIIKTFGWKYISVVYEESNYGIKAFEELETQLSRAGVCIAVKERLRADADARTADAAVRRLQSRARARGVVVFASARAAAALMAAVVRLNASGQFAWLGSDGWSGRAAVADGRERAVEGAVCVQPQANPVRGFAEYFLNLTVENNQRNPWFVEYWEEHFQCRHSGSPQTALNGRLPPCSGRERLSADSVQFDRKLQFIGDAVFAFVYAIRDMHSAVCGGAAGLCAALRHRRAGTKLLHFLRNVRFTGLSGDEFQFDGNGDGPARYDILHFKRTAYGHQWARVGGYRYGRLELRTEELVLEWGSPQPWRPPQSVCSADCARGQAKQYVEGESCCWHCFNCSQYEIRSPETETACVPCPLGAVPDGARTACVRLPARHVRPESPAALAVMAFAALGIAFTAVVCVVWVVRGGTPAVRASGRELSLVLLCGCALCYTLTFALLQTPTDLICAIQRFGAGSCFAVVYAALLTKTSRIARIFAASRRSARRPPFISPRSQLLICAALVSVQVVVCAVWQVAAPARALLVSPSRDQLLLVCDSFVDASIAIAFFYPSLLIIVCTVYAVVTRNIPEAFNESKHIGFAMYTTCVLWLTFAPLYWGARVALRVLALALTVSLSASVTLVCLFTPKLYIILWRPERNVRASLMPARWAQALLPALHAPHGPHGPHGPHTPDTPDTTATLGTPLTPSERPPKEHRHVQTEPLETPADGVAVTVADGAAVTVVDGAAVTVADGGRLQRGVLLTVTSLK